MIFHIIELKGSRIMKADDLVIYITRLSHLRTHFEHSTTWQVLSFALSTYCCGS